MLSTFTELSKSKSSEKLKLFWSTNLRALSCIRLILLFKLRLWNIKIRVQLLNWETMKFIRLLRLFKPIQCVVLKECSISGLLFHKERRHGSNGFWTHNHLVRNERSTSLVKWLIVRSRTKWLLVRIQLLPLKLRNHAWLEQEAPWHSANYRVWIHSEMRTWYDNNIQSEETWFSKELFNLKSF